MGFKINGYMEPRALDDTDSDEKTNNITIFNTVNSTPPSYESVVTQERAQKQLIGGLLYKTSKFFGVRPFRAPYDCDGNVCQKRRFSDRICPIALPLCFINILVIINHFYIHTNDKPSLKISLLSREWAELFMKSVDSIFPLVCIVGMILKSYYMHTLLQKLTDTHFSVLQIKCNRRVNFWRYTLYIITFFFVIGAIFELPQNFIKEFGTQSKPPSTANHTVKLHYVVNMPIKEMKLFNKVLMFIDRYYYPIINFGVVKIPQLYIMMISIHIALMFHHTNKMIKNRYLTNALLENYFNQFIEVVKVQQMFECCFNKIILAIVTTSVVKIIFTSYVTILELFNSESLNIFSLFVYQNNQIHDNGSMLSFLSMLNNTCSIFSMILNIFWAIVFIVPCIWCNEASRAGLIDLTNQIVSNDAKNTKDQIIQKLTDPLWGVTIGNFAKADRTLAISIFSLVFTVLVVWVQLSIGQNYY